MESSDKIRCSRCARLRMTKSFSAEELKTEDPICKYCKADGKHKPVTRKIVKCMKCQKNFEAMPTYPGSFGLCLTCKGTDDYRSSGYSEPVELIR